jgi:anti-sigma factor RsiW
MAPCAWKTKVERWFDGESAGGAAVEEHVEACTSCRAHVVTLERMREGIEVVAVRPVIADTQLPAFMAGIRDEVAAPQARRGGLWAYVSLAAAALIVSFSTFMIFTTGADEVVATVDSAVTELEGGEVHYQTEGNTTTIWINVAEHRDIQ